MKWFIWLLLPGLIICGCGKSSTQEDRSASEGGLNFLAAPQHENPEQSNDSWALSSAPNQKRTDTSLEDASPPSEIIIIENFKPFTP